MPRADIEASGWRVESQRQHRRVLTGRYAHWCEANGRKPVDESCAEWPCTCAPELEAAASAMGAVTAGQSS